MQIKFLGIAQQNAIIIDSLDILVDKNPTAAIDFGNDLLNNNDFTTFENAKITYYLALAYQKNKNHKKALEYFEESIPILEKSTDYRAYISALLSQSNSNVYLNSFTAATEEAIQARNLAIKHKINDLVASANTSLSFIYYATADYERALEYLASSEAIFIKENKDRELSAVYNNMAILYKKMNAIKKAIAYNKKSLKISLKDKHYFGVGKSYSNIGRLYSLEADYKNAIKFYQKAIQNNLDHNIINSIPYANLGDAFIAIKNFKRAEENLLKALEIEQNNKNDFEIKKLYDALLKVAITNKSYKKAFKYRDEIERINKNIEKHNNEEKIRMIKNQNELWKKQNELKITKRKSKNQLIFFVTFIALLLFLGLFLFQKNKNKKLKEEKNRLFLEQKVLRSQMNPHFIFNALSAIQNSLLDNEPIKSASYLSRFAKLIRQNFDFIDKKKIVLAEEIDALTNYMETQKMRYNDKFDYEINTTDIDTNTIEIPPLLLQPFVENAIEHGFKRIDEIGKLTIQIFKKQKFICFEIKDNGIGFEKSIKDSRKHAIDIFIKRLELRGFGEEKSFNICSDSQGTMVKFCLKL